MFSLPFSFARARHWSAAQSSLPILAVLIGMLLGSAGTALVDTYWTAPISIRGRRVKPEGRLPQLILSTILLPVGLLWFAWTSSASVPWPVQASSGVLIGAGIVLNPLATTTHFIEMYELHANSALAGCNCCKFVAAAATPLFAVPMFEKLGVQWACSLMAFVCVVFAVFPFLYWRHREMIRNASKWAVESKG